MENKNEDRMPSSVTKTFRKVLQRSKQDLERGLRKPGWLFPAVQHRIEKDDLKGDPNKIGKITIEPFNPRISSAEFGLSVYMLKRFQRWLLGRKPPQKRVRPRHERDKKLAPTPVENKQSMDQETTKHRRMDKLIFKETERIKDDKEFAQANKRGGKRYTQSKCRYLHPLKK